MNIITDLRQHHQTFDPTAQCPMPFKYDELADLLIGFENPANWPTITPRIVNNDLSRLVLRNVTATFVEREGGTPAYYPNLDYVRLLPTTAYEVSPETNYLHSVMHELSHASGHVSRLNRAMGRRQGASGYSFEELIAETCAAMLLDKFGVYEETRDMHAKYIARHLHHGQFDDKMSALEQVSVEAQKAFEYMTRRNN